MKAIMRFFARDTAQPVQRPLDHDPLVERAARKILTVLEEAHDFDFRRLSKAEASRLNNFVQNVSMEAYPALSELDEKLFVSAKYLCIEIVKGEITSWARTSVNQVC